MSTLCAPSITKEDHNYDGNMEDLLGRPSSIHALNSRNHDVWMAIEIIAYMTTDAYNMYHIFPTSP